MNNFICDDLRETHRVDTITRVIDRHRTVDPNAQMLVIILEYQPKNPTNNINQRKSKSFEGISIRSAVLFSQYADGKSLYLFENGLFDDYV